MCGMAGIVHFDGCPVDNGVLRRMADALRHRPVKTFPSASTMRATASCRTRIGSRRCEHHEFVVRPKAIEVLPRLARLFGEAQHLDAVDAMLFADTMFY